MTWLTDRLLSYLQVWLINTRLCQGYWRLKAQSQSDSVVIGYPADWLGFRNISSSDWFGMRKSFAITQLAIELHNQLLRKRNLKCLCPHTDLTRRRGWAGLVVAQWASFVTCENLTTVATWFGKTCLKGGILETVFKTHKSEDLLIPPPQESLNTSLTATMTTWLKEVNDKVVKGSKAKVVTYVKG